MEKQHSPKIIMAILMLMEFYGGSLKCLPIFILDSEEYLTVH